MLFMLQVILPTDDTFKHISEFLSDLGIDISGVGDKAVAIAVIFLLPFVICVLIFQTLLREMYERLTLPGRVAEYREAVGKIVRYHERNMADELSSYIKKSKSAASPPRVKALLDIMLDLLITDLRDAVQELCLCADIRISLYEMAFERVDQTTQRAMLVMTNTTEFDKDSGTSTIFYENEKTRQFSGYCGKAWNTQLPQCGTYAPFPFWRDKDFFLGNAFDKDRSFLCLPISEVNGGQKRMIAVLTIDSGRRYDFLLGNDLKDKIYISTMDMRNLLIKYLSWRAPF